MQSYFNDLADRFAQSIQGEEVYTAYYSGEKSEFVRFNQTRIRQPGSVTQGYVHLELVDGKRHAGIYLPIAGVEEIDRPRCDEAMTALRERLKVLPEDPYLLLATEVHSTERVEENQLPSAPDTVDRILEASEGLDLVGIYAQGGISRGFANSFGQRNWFSTHSFNFDWSYYAHDDKAVKSSFAGFEWNQGEFEGKVQEARHQLGILGRPARTIEPGGYRVYLAPSALQEILGIMAWGGFGKRSHATRQTAFLKMIEGKASLNPAVSIAENIAGGVDADFNTQGFTKPDRVDLISEGMLGDCLVSPRSAMEFDCQPNGASNHEIPSSIDMTGGSMSAVDVQKDLGSGVYVNNLWYLNFSDRNSFRITGMTRFGSFWVENGEITAPINVMRFDESVFRMLGKNLVGLTAEREMILDSKSYNERATASLRLPGALIENFTFTL